MQHRDRLTEDERRVRRAESARAYRERNREKCAAASLASRAKKPDQYRDKDRLYKQDAGYLERQAQYRAENRDRINASAAAWQAANAEKYAAYQSAYRRENSDAQAARSARWRSENAEQEKSVSARWAKNNPERRRINEHKRRALKAASGGSLSRDIYQRLLALQKGLCVTCRADLSIAGLHLDHYMPLALGGANTDSNVQLLCPPCNLSKGPKHPVDFMQQRGFLC